MDLLLQGKNGPSIDLGLGGVVALLILILVIWVIVKIWTSHKALIPKVVWTLIVVLLPILGLILYFFLGRER